MAARAESANGLLDAETLAAATKAFRRGASRQEAARVIGARRTDMQRWLQQGRGESRAGQNTLHAALYRAYVGALDERAAQVADRLFDVGMNGYTETVTQKVVGPDGTEKVVGVTEKHHAVDVQALDKWLTKVYLPAKALQMGLPGNGLPGRHSPNGGRVGGAVGAGGGAGGPRQLPAPEGALPTTWAELLQRRERASDEDAEDAELVETPPAPGEKEPRR